MTATADDIAFLAAICSEPAEDTHRLVYADWLDENAKTEGCPRCNGEGMVTTRWRQAEMDADEYGYSTSACDRCNGTGSVSDGRHERAALIRGMIAHPEWYADDTCLETGPNSDRQYLAGLDWLKSGAATEDFGPVQKHHWVWYRERTDGVVGLYQRGFISQITCTAEQWLQHADALAWHPSQTVECPGCEKCRNHAGRIYTGMDGMKWIPCRIPRPCPPTAQPIERVTLVDIEPWDLGASEPGGFRYAWWSTHGPQVTNRSSVPAAIYDRLDGHNRRFGGKAYPTADDAFAALSTALNSRWPDITFEFS